MIESLERSRGVLILFFFIVYIEREQSRPKYIIIFFLFVGYQKILLDDFRIFGLVHEPWIDVPPGIRNIFESFGQKMFQGPKAATGIKDREIIGTRRDYLDEFDEIQFLTMSLQPSDLFLVSCLVVV